MLSRKGGLLRGFNTYFFEFLDTAASFFPENADIRTARTSADMLKRANPTVIVKAWHAHLAVPYAQEILQNNFDFFAEKDYRTDMQHFDCDSSAILEIIDELRGALRNASEEQKIVLLEFIQRLSALSTNYINEF